MPFSQRDQLIWHIFDLICIQLYTTMHVLLLLSSFACPLLLLSSFVRFVHYFGASYRRQTVGLHRFVYLQNIWKSNGIFLLLSSVSDAMFRWFSILFFPYVGRSSANRAPSGIFDSSKSILFVWRTEWVRAWVCMCEKERKRDTGVWSTVANVYRYILKRLDNHMDLIDYL